ncbi:uncharacterized protein LOC134832673 [Culicoides brevitarsis]|uniref:uncharacterized protein LOC134832673 n=1 Tax=Culicoides brevitarsis TaxID=469753 RepID=UPI00307BB18E
MLTEHQQREFAEKAEALKLQKQKQQAQTSRIHESPRCCSYQDNLGANEYRKDRRVHGFQLPLHPLQIAGWIAIVIFVTAAFALLIPVLPPNLQPAFYCVLTVLFVVHVVSHIAAVLTDPADRELRRISTRQVVPEFDRAKHAHVIENGRCHLCNIKTTSNRTKHCSVCNKCVGRFDHHCKWLNHCIGGRNYVAFLMCVLSAVIAVLVILTACIAEITLYYFKPDWLNIWSDVVAVNDTLLDENEGTTIINEVIEQTNATLIGNLTNVLIGNGTENNETLVETLDDDDKNLGLSINGTIFVIFAATVGLLAAISAGLLLHLCFFHVYISYLGLTTYEYIRNQRTSATNAYPPQYTQKNGTHHKKENGLQQTSNGGNHQNGTSNRRYTTFFRSKSAEAYFCSNINPISNSENVAHVDIESQNRPKTLYCCDTVESHHHRHKAYYMCSVLEDANPENSMNDLSRINYYPEDEARYESKTFHCCSEFVENQPAVATVTGILEQSRRETAFLHYTEQCTFCSFRIKRPVTRQQQQRVSASMEDKRCCIKTVATKHHRWRRKWNCCSNVPDSPDVPMASQFLTQNLPNSVVNVRQMNETGNPETSDQQNNNLEQATTTSTTITISSYDENSANNNNFSVMNGNNDASPNNNSAPTPQTDNVQEIITISSSLSNISSSSTTTIMPPSSSSSNNPTPSKRMRVRSIRPVIRLRHMFRVLGKRYRRPRCRHIAAAAQVKQNQIRPLPQQNTGNSLIVTSPVQQQASPNGQYSTVTHQTILPTSAIRNESQQQHLLVLPALPPPQRRRIKTTETDIQELADTLTLVQEQQTPSTIIRLSTSKSRRKQILRPRSPTLSPIHESGLSNPTSPLPKHRQSSVETPSDDILHITSEDCIN